MLKAEPRDEKRTVAAQSHTVFSIIHLPSFCANHRSRQVGSSQAKENFIKDKHF